MGVKQRGAQGSGKTYFGIYSDQLVIQYDDRESLEKKCDQLGFDPEDILVRKKTKGKNEGQEVFYIVVDAIDGLIQDIRINETDWGDFVEIELDDIGDKFIVSLGDVFESRMAKDFVRRIGNLDLGKELVFGVWSMTKEETGSSKRSGVKMYQDDEKVEYAIGYDEMPEPEEKKKGKNTTWDYTEQSQYLFEQLDEFIKENFSTKVDEKEREEKEPPNKNKGRRKPAASKRKNARKASKPKKNEEPVEEEEDDDAPF